MVSEKRVVLLYTVFILYKNVVGPGAVYLLIVPAAPGALDSNPTLPRHHPEFIYFMYIRSAVFNEVHTLEDLKWS